MKHSLDVITIGEAMAMFVATQIGDVADVEHFIKRVAGHRSGAPGAEGGLGQPRG